VGPCLFVYSLYRQAVKKIEVESKAIPVIGRGDLQGYEILRIPEDR
jgi:hypothetical protein